MTVQFGHTGERSVSSLHLKGDKVQNENFYGDYGKLLRLCTNSLY